MIVFLSFLPACLDSKPQRYMGQKWTSLVCPVCSVSCLVVSCMLSWTLNTATPCLQTINPSRGKSHCTAASGLLFWSSCVNEWRKSHSIAQHDMITARTESSVKSDKNTQLQVNFSPHSANIKIIVTTLTSSFTDFIFSFRKSGFS